jgi:hypothetical protein
VPPIEYVKTPTYQYPISGFPIPLEEPTPTERDGLLLRYKPVYGKVLTYEGHQINHGTESGKTDKWRSDYPTKHQLRFASGSENDLFQVESIFTCTFWSGSSWQTTSVSKDRYTMDVRGRIPPHSNERKVQVQGVRIIDEYSNGPDLPEEPVRIGDFWDQQSEQNTTQLFARKFARKDDYTHTRATVKWRLSGFASVRGHRCAVLEAIAEATGTKERIVKYFDYSLGLEVETVTFCYSSSPDIDWNVESQTISSLTE